ncbi:uncharacterized protein ISCGN_020837 [Ixodes scapularis]
MRHCSSCSTRVLCGVRDGVFIFARITSAKFQCTFASTTSACHRRRFKDDGLGLFTRLARMEGDETTSHDMVFSLDPPPVTEDASSEEDLFEGEGTVEAPPLGAKPLASPIHDALHRIVYLCDGRDDGVVTLDRLMEVIETNGFSTSNQDESTLTWVHSALCRESEAEGLVEDVGSGRKDVLVNVLTSRVIRELLNHFQKEAHLDESDVGLPLLLDPSECGMVSPVGHMGGGDAGDGAAGVRTSSRAANSGSSPSESLSALGASLFSFGSHEGIAGDVSFQ